ncbi:hypothetical protein AA103196_0563 [Ameyamaea chiangmaiensis NBRC 103196]|nr:hypothetical protein AA103196_0563 [Ameyamaea chiangmaiensis NBRC 103196]
MLLPWARWILALHVIAVIAWMSGLFYLPRLFVYHCETAPGSTESERFKVMERRLLRAIINPAMVVAFACGAALAATPGLIDWSAGWWHAKLAGVIGMFAFHGACARWRRAFADDRNTRSARFYRLANEVPTLLMILIVVMIIVRP